MPYYNVNVHTLYQSCISASWDWHTNPKNDLLIQAKAWVEAENAIEIWGLIQEWFEMLENNTAIHQYPDIFWENDKYPDLKPLTQDVADEFVEELDADFMLEKNRFQGRGAPDFNRLAPHSRMAFAQAFYRITMSEKQITEKARELVDAGTKIPPKEDGKV